MLAEVKVLCNIAELRNAFSDSGSPVGPLVGFRINPFAAKEIVLYELHISIKAEVLVVDITLFGIGG
ncbi:Uncharacterised protein [uncultured archaeon]|nr:Uncharacterised protein [uncultured archaeon]